MARIGTLPLSARNLQQISKWTDNLMAQPNSFLATSGARDLHWARDGNTLYVATEAAADGRDVFIYLARVPGELTDANWAKTGQVAAWDAYLADEHDNSYHSWFDANSSADSATGSVLEGVIDLAAEFGTLPEEIYLAVGVFATADGGELVPSMQVPASLNGNGNIEALEFVRLHLGPDLPGDFNDNGVVDAADYVLWRNRFGMEFGLANDPTPGSVDLQDYQLWRMNFGRELTLSAGSLSRVPEPMSWQQLVMALLCAAGGRWIAARRRVLADCAPCSPFA
jgi:hypothetical protein